MIKKPCLLCNGSGELVDRITKQLRPCALCRGKGFVRVEVPNVKKRKKRAAVDTIEKVLSFIREYQKEYLATWDVMTLKPMRLRDISDMTKVNEATVCKSIRGQMIDNVEVKELFSIPVSGVSNKAIMHMMKLIIEKHTHASDLDVVNRLASNGVNVARRTVAKYRKQLRIPKAKNR